MFFRNNVFIVLLLLLIVVGGITLLFKPGYHVKKLTVNDTSFNNIDIVTTNASIEIIPTKDTVTTVEYSGKAKKKSNYLFDADIKGETLSILFKEKRWRFFNFDFSSFNLKLTIKVPEKEYNLLRAETDNGQISLGQFHVKGLELKTDNGGINLNNVDAETVNVQTDNGKILLNQVEGDIIASTDNGGISLTTDHLDRPIDLATDNGKIEILTDKEPTNATIDAKTDNGKVEIFGKENRQVTFGKGQHLVKLRTDNGRITVAK